MPTIRFPNKRLNATLLHDLRFLLPRRPPLGAVEFAEDAIPGSFFVGVDDHYAPLIVLSLGLLRHWQDFTRTSLT